MKKDPSKKAVLITGVSSGIGHAAARYLIDRGYFVFGSIRTDSEAARLERVFPDNFKALVFDITDKTAVTRASGVVREMLDGQNLSALVNNAGVAVPGPMQLLDDDRFRHQIEVGLFGVRNVTNAFLPLLGARPGMGKGVRRRNQNAPGKIINISSLSGILNTPMKGAYCIAKHAMESLGEIYRRELHIYGIDVVSIQPGPVRSRIWGKNLKTMSAYSGTDYTAMIENTEKMMAKLQKHAVPAERVSRLIHGIIEAKHPKCAYVVYRYRWRAIMMARFLPARFVDRMLRRALNR